MTSELTVCQDGDALGLKATNLENDETKVIIRNPEQETKIIELKDILNELRSEKRRYEQLVYESEAEKRKYQELSKGGKRKMSKFKLIIAGVSAAALFNFCSYFYGKAKEQGILAEQLQTELSWTKDNSYTLKEWERLAALRSELSSQINSANNYLKEVEEANADIKVFVSDAKAYIEIATPRGELEDSVAKEAERLNRFFESYASSTEEMEAAINECYELSKKGINGSSKSKLREQVSGLNNAYITVFNQIKENARYNVEELAAFKEYAANYPLKQRKEIISRAEQEIQRIAELVKRLDSYIEVFSENAKSKEIIPVAMRAVEGNDN